MRVASFGDRFGIVRGSSKPQYFLFLVDDDSSCWSAKRDNATLYERKDLALAKIDILRVRDRLKRNRRLAEQQRVKAAIKEKS